MADPNQQESLLHDKTSSRYAPYPLLGRYHKSKSPSIVYTRVSYSPISDQHSAHPAPPYPSPTWPSPGVDDGFDDVRIRSLESMREKDTVSFLSLLGHNGERSTNYDCAPTKAMKQQIRQMKFFVRMFTLALAIYSLVTMVYTLKQFLETRDHKVVLTNISAGGKPVVRGPWFKESKTWPTVLLMATSAITLLLNLLVMVAYFKSVGTANTTALYFTYVSYIMGATHLAMWIPTAAAYRAGRTGKDLWGWSCSAKAAQTQAAFLGVVDFQRTCHIQTAAWASSVAQALLMMLTFVLWWWEYRRLKHKRDLQTHHSIAVKETRWSKMIPTGHRL